MTKITWDNAAYLSASTAKRLGVATGDVVRLKVEAREVQAERVAVRGGTFVEELERARQPAEGRLGRGQPGTVRQLGVDRAAGHDAPCARAVTASNVAW